MAEILLLEAGASIVPRVSSMVMSERCNLAIGANNVINEAILAKTSLPE
jgi:hypothetical protein